MNTIFHDSRKTRYRRPFGAIETGSTVCLCADFPAEAQNRTLVLRFESGTEKETDLYPVAEQSVTLYPEKPGVYFYHFEADGFSEESEHQLTVYEKDLSVPQWFLNTIIYQIFPDRFYEGTGPVVRKKDSFLYADKTSLPTYVKSEDGTILRWDFYGGNLWGVREKLPYLKALGVDTIYLNPIFESVSNHRYDTGNYKKTDGMLGGDAAFDAMMKACKEENIRVVLDGVFSHTGAESLYFDRSGSCKEGKTPEEQGAFQSAKSHYRDWYRFREDGSYDCWWGVTALPNVNELTPSYLDYILTGSDSVIRFWERRGVSGWRLDVADELPDAFIETLRNVSEEENPEAVVFGEVWEDASNKISYGERRSYYTKKELHSNTNYLFRNILLNFFSGKISAADALDHFMTLSENYPAANFYAQVNMTGSHDVRRLFTCMKEITDGQEELAKDLVRAYSLIQFTFPGVPLIYYGDESCLEGEADPDNRRYFPWHQPDKDMIAWFSGLCKMRKSHPALVSGTWKPLYSDDNLFVFARFLRTECFVTAIDRFGRGADYLRAELEKKIGKDYTIEKQAGGYGILLQLDQNTEVLRL